MIKLIEEFKFLLRLPLNREILDLLSFTWISFLKEKLWYLIELRKLCLRIY